MSLVVRMMTPPLYQHAVLLAIVTTRLCGGDVVSVKRIAVSKERFAQTTPNVLGVESARALPGDGARLQSPLCPVCPVGLQGGMQR